MKKLLKLLIRIILRRKRKPEVVYVSAPARPSGSNLDNNALEELSDAGFKI
ncbi:MAG: hypothetical protein V4438_03300 [Patescibacteria group bacterium]